MTAWSRRKTTGSPDGGTCTEPATIPSLGSSPERARDKVAKVNYAGLDSSPYKSVKEKLGYSYTGSVLSFEIETASFWKDSPEIKNGELRTEDIGTEVFLMPAATHVEKA